jgi:hypothetical protein
MSSENLPKWEFKAAEAAGLQSATFERILNLVAGETSRDRFVTIGARADARTEPAGVGS